MSEFSKYKGFITPGKRYISSTGNKVVDVKATYGNRAAIILWNRVTKGDVPENDEYQQESIADVAIYHKDKVAVLLQEH